MFSWKFYGVLIAFLIFGIVSAVFPIYSSLHFLHVIHTHANMITFDKGAYYAFGAGLLFIIGPLWVFYVLYKEKRGLNPKTLNQTQTRRVQRTVYIFFGVCLAITFFLPQVVSTGVDQYLVKQGYTYCGKRSKQWLLDRTMVYTKSTCE